MSRLHRVGRILVETQAPSTNTQWLSAVEHVKTHAQQKRIKALPLGHLLNLTKNARKLHYKRYEHDAVMAVFEATAWLQTCVSALPGGWISICRSSRAQPLLPVLVVKRSEGHPYIGQLQACPKCQQPQQPTADHITQLCPQAAWLAQRQNTDVKLLFDKRSKAQDFYSNWANVQGILRLSLLFLRGTCTTLITAVHDRDIGAACAPEGGRISMGNIRPYTRVHYSL